MIVIIGLVILVAAVAAGVAGVLTNSGHAHPAGQFAVMGYHVTGSTGTVFLYGIVAGAAALAGLSLLLAGARRTSRRGRDARQGLRQSRRETAAVTQHRDELIKQRDTVRARTASTPGEDATARNGSDPGPPAPGPVDRIRGRGSAPRQVSPQPEAWAGQATATEAPAAEVAAAEVPSRAPATAE